MSTIIRPVVNVEPGMPASDGAGVRLTRLVGTPAVEPVDPFLMLDYFASDEPTDYLAGFPAHPHRGFETVTYMLAGRLRHGDNKGHSGVIEAGGVQWMTAGRGIVHEEMPEQDRGLMRGFQLWVNLPARLKMTEPRYQEFDATRIPAEARAGGVTVKVIAGATSRGTAGPIDSAPTAARYFDVVLPAGAVFEEPLAADLAAFVAVYEGAAAVAGQQVEAVSVAVLGAGDAVSVQAGPAGARLLLIAGRPIREPVAWSGPFVMNTRAEVMQAMADYQAGRF